MTPPFSPQNLVFSFLRVLILGLFILEISCNSISGNENGKKDSINLDNAKSRVKSLSTKVLDNQLYTLFISKKEFREYVAKNPPKDTTHNPLVFMFKTDNTGKLDLVAWKRPHDSTGEFKNPPLMLIPYKASIGSNLDTGVYLGNQILHKKQISKILNSPGTVIYFDPTVKNQFLFYSIYVLPNKLNDKEKEFIKSGLSAVDTTNPSPPRNYIDPGNSNSK